jgi:hypothetical protein
MPGEVLLPELTAQVVSPIGIPGRWKRRYPLLRRCLFCSGHRNFLNVLQQTLQTIHTAANMYSAIPQHLEESASAHGRAKFP